MSEQYLKRHARHNHIYRGNFSGVGLATNLKIRTCPDVLSGRLRLRGHRS